MALRLLREPLPVRLMATVESGSPTPDPFSSSTAVKTDGEGPSAFAISYPLDRT